MVKSFFNFSTTYTKLSPKFYQKCQPKTVESPELIVLNNALLNDLEVDFSGLSKQYQAQLLSGNHLPEGAIPFSQSYAGHQFAHFTMLGDGRAHMLGEHVKSNGQRFDIQLKGSGPTPYSRGGDGRAALGPMLREYIISESMFYLGVPTTRSLAVVATGEPVIREVILPGAVLTRVASSHIRFGTFEFAATQSPESVNELLTYTLERHYPELLDASNPALAFLKKMMEMHIDLVINWMRVGFIHGVMNTDNMSISGETIDYGPCAFMDIYNPKTVFSAIDHQGRYAFGNQPKILRWNLARLAQALLLVISHNVNEAISLAQEVLGQFDRTYEEKWLDMMKSKLGLGGSCPEDSKIIDDLLNWMKINQRDYTNTFFDLSLNNLPKDKIYQQHDFLQWYHRWQMRLEKNHISVDSSRALMQKINPAIIARNHQVERVLKAAYFGDFKPLDELIDVLRGPYEYHSIRGIYQVLPKPEERVYRTFCGT